MALADTTIGIIIGSLFTTLGVVLQGIISWILEGRKKSLELKKIDNSNRYEFQKEFLQKREQAYQEFADLFGLLLTLSGSALSGFGKPIIETINGEFYQKVAHALSAVRMYGTDDMFSAAQQFSVSFSQVMKTGQLNQEMLFRLDQQLGSVVAKMGRELLSAHIK